MDKEPRGDFLRAGARPEQKTPIEYERAAMAANLDAFTEKERPIIIRYLHDESLEPAEAEIMRVARARWFEKEYGVPYQSSRTLRQAVVLQKHAPPLELVQAHELQEELFEALGGDVSSEKIAKLKQEYVAKYPDQLEGVGILLIIRPFLELSRKFDKKNPDYDPRKYSKKEKLRAFQSMTESNFLLAHFVAANNSDKEFLSLFWSALENIARRAGLSKEMNNIRRGTVTQVATMRIFEELGLHPRLSHPRDDAFSKIDLWSDASHAVQIKSTGKNELEMIETDTITFPGTEVEYGGGPKHISSEPLTEEERFGAKLEEYRRSTGQPDLKGLFIRIPSSKVDFITGKPDEELVAAVRRKIGIGQ
jgi:hypothetical protein